MPNVELAERVLEQIRTHPEEWDQKHWFFRADCGTSYCMAGWTVKLAHPEAKFVSVAEGEQYGATVILSDRSRRHIADVAREALDLRPEESGELFYYGNTLDDLEYMVEQLRNNGKITTPGEDDYYDDYYDD